jgi:hypothetical protein
MPKRNRKKSKKKGRSDYSGIMTVNADRAISSVPDRMLVRMVYSQFFTTSSLATATQVFNLNSTFDPDRTGVGHQPLGRDNWVLFYNRYRVTAVDVEWQSCRVDSLTAGGVCCMFPNNNAAATTVDTCIEQPYAKWAIINSPTAFGKVKLSLSLPLHKLVGRTIQQYMADDQLQALFSADPSEIIALNCAVVSIDGSSIIQTHNVIRITYHVELFDRFQLTQSVELIKRLQSSAFQMVEERDLKREVSTLSKSVSTLTKTVKSK